VKAACEASGQCLQNTAEATGHAFQLCSQSFGKPIAPSLGHVDKAGLPGQSLAWLQLLELLPTVRTTLVNGSVSNQIPPLWEWREGRHGSRIIVWGGGGSWHETER
jgi:hypothetical protein